MYLLDGEYVPDEVTTDDVRWAMNLAVVALQGAYATMDLETYCTKVAEVSVNLLATQKLIEDEFEN